MRTTPLSIFAAGLFLTGGFPAFGFDHTGYQAHRAEPQEQQLTEHRHYENTDHDVVHSPAHSVNGQVPTGAVARCGDGTFSFSRHRRGTCSHHQGVANWIAER